MMNDRPTKRTGWQYSCQFPIRRRGIFGGFISARMASTIPRCPRIVSIRSSTRSIGTVIGLFTPWKGYLPEVRINRAAGPQNAKAPGKGASLDDEHSVHSRLFPLCPSKVKRQCPD